MSQKQHKKQLDRARAKRQTSRLDRRRARNRIVILVMVFLMAFSLIAGAVASLFAGSETPEAPLPDEVADAPADDPADDPGDDPGEDPLDALPGAEALVDPDDPPFAILAEPGTEPRAVIETDLGPITVELDPDAAPLATNSFLDLAGQGFFDDVVFHRVIEEFVIQGGDPTGTGTGGPGYRFPDELEAAEELVAAEGGYPRGTLAMANSGPDTNGSQFFIVHGDLVELPPLYTVFGRVVDGLEVVDAIATTDTDPADRPVEAIAMSEVRVELP